MGLRRPRSSLTPSSYRGDTLSLPTVSEHPTTDPAEPLPGGPPYQPASKWRAYLHPAEWWLRVRVWFMSLAFDPEDDLLAERARESPEDRLDTALQLADSAAETRKHREHES